MQTEWHYATDGQQHGPVNAEELHRLADTGTLRPTDLVWKEGLPEWLPASQVKGLFPSPPPLPEQQATTAGQPGLSGVGGDSPPPMGSASRSFSDWYGAKFGQQPLGTQILLWVFYGFLWIPILYAVGGGIPTRAAVVSAGRDRSGAPAGFTEWYAAGFGRLPVLIQIVLWLFYGFLWIPILYLMRTAGRSRWAAWSYCPGLTWAAWLHAFVRTRHVGFLGLAAVYAVPFFLVSALDELGQELPDWLGVLILFSWFGGILHVSSRRREVEMRIAGNFDGTADRPPAPSVHVCPPASPAASAEIPPVRPSAPAASSPASEPVPAVVVESFWDRLTVRRVAMWGAAALGSFVTQKLIEHGWDYLRTVFGLA